MKSATYGNTEYVWVSNEKKIVLTSTTASCVDQIFTRPPCKPLPTLTTAASLPPPHSLTSFLSELAKRSKGHGKKSKSTHSSRTSRSTSPLADSRKTSGTHGSTQTNSKVPPKRRNTMNSRDPDLEHVLDLSRKEAERAGLIPEGGSGGAGSAIGDEDQIDIGAAGAAGRGRKRKRAGESDGGDA